MLFFFGTAQKENQEFRQRRNYGERPMFGTVQDIFQGGEKGLVSAGPQDEAEAAKSQERDWEKALTYGKPKRLQ